MTWFRVRSSALLLPATSARTATLLATHSTIWVDSGFHDPPQQANALSNPAQEAGIMPYQTRLGRRPGQREVGPWEPMPSLRKPSVPVSPRAQAAERLGQNHSILCSDRELDAPTPDIVPLGVADHDPADPDLGSGRKRIFLR